MIPVHVPCSACGGKRYEFSFTAQTAWPICRACDGLGRQWAPGAPAYGCTITLADREPGEIVTLGNGQRAKILWHQPRKRPKVRPEATFIDILDTSGFFETETFIPVPYPSCVGVTSVDAPRAVSDREAHDRDRTEDPNDPVQRHAGALL